MPSLLWWSSESMHNAEIRMMTFLKIRKKYYWHQIFGSKMVFSAFIMCVMFSATKITYFLRWICEERCWFPICEPWHVLPPHPSRHPGWTLWSTGNESPARSTAAQNKSTVLVWKFFLHFLKIHKHTTSYILLCYVMTRNYLPIVCFAMKTKLSRKMRIPIS